MLASTARLVGRWWLGEIASGAAAKAARARPDRLESRQHRRGQRDQPPGGQETDPNPTDRGKLDSKRHVVVDARGVPLAIMVTGANRHDSMAFESTLDAIPAVPGLDGRPRKRPSKLHADKGYDYAWCRRYLRKRGHHGTHRPQGI